MMYKHVITGEIIDEERFDELVDEEMEMLEQVVIE